MENIINYEDLPFIVVFSGWILTIIILIWYYWSQGKEEKAWKDENVKLRADYLELQAVAIKVHKHDEQVIEMVKKTIIENEALLNDNNMIHKANKLLVNKVNNLQRKLNYKSKSLPK